ncbi:NAD(+) synthase [Clostridiaceae bacterium OttesenSCG-928-D20]|nr:NAD(+) synthase [Clostridiaceae bacterium OttesenSCG-928-D20]
MSGATIKLALATPRVKVSDLEFNFNSIKGYMQSSYENGAEILLLPELSLSALSCGSLFETDFFLKSSARYFEKLINLSSETGDMLTVLGLPLSVDGQCYNCVAVVQGGRILGIAAKSRFIGGRECEIPSGFSNIDLPLQKKIPFGKRMVFAAKGMRFVIEFEEALLQDRDLEKSYNGIDLILCPGKTQKTIGSERSLRQNLSSLSAKTAKAIAIAGAGEGQSSSYAVYSGHKLAVSNGIVFAEELSHRGIVFTELPVQPFYENKTIFAEQSPPKALSKTPFISERYEKEGALEALDIQAMALRQRMLSSNSKRLILGLSGGLDSTLAALACVKCCQLYAISPKSILAVSMPCFGTTKRTKNNAEALAAALDIDFQTIDISKTVLSHFEDISHDFEDKSVVFENAQARERTQVLMDIANKEGGIVVGTGDLSEMALGWSTYNGDHMSMYAINASIPKTLVRSIVSCYAETSENEALSKVLTDILNTPVSPELLPPKDGDISQITEDKIGPYILHDFFLWHFIKTTSDPSLLFELTKKVFEDDYSPEEILKWLRVFISRFFSQQFKRSCSPDAPKVTEISLSSGEWVMPSDCSSKLWQSELARFELGISN